MGLSSSLVTWNHPAALAGGGAGAPLALQAGGAPAPALHTGAGGRGQ